MAEATSTHDLETVPHKEETTSLYEIVEKHYYRSLIKHISIDDAIIGLQLIGVTVGVSILGLFLYYVVVK